ncbi:N-acetylmuramic acid 6-phosphate etherase [Alteromonas sp. W364]|jgi:N-acetylmuramic acid 6-phosphate etherase|uniref:N-acetylmuramic acid 6-phosphate etherase n=1 Tax=Alteromonas sp. W364 TaxID=3075610 RepID=UPI0028848354|nr:N-acetylmuramic acid 6-phosphate etherase [Alteromonas sp. W364]MDT0628772.1 N-acetylmuramic acid 6-phosphate etherase [Alteromonas sp. W364]
MDKTDKIRQEIQSIPSETRLRESMDIDSMSTIDALKVINAQDKTVPYAISNSLDDIAEAVDASAHALSQGGRLIYIGAGTSGRLGILDAVECRPTFSVPDDLVVGIIAGGEKALIHAVEGAEDDALSGKRDLINISLSSKDIVIGLAASGRTPYVLGAIEYANSLSCATACIVCNPDAPLLKLANIGIVANVGPEVLTGSTRMKSGTAQKLILNMISTTTMIKLGKTYSNLMVDVNATNEKLLARAVHIVMQATTCSAEKAKATLAESNNNAKLAILMILTNSDVTTSKAMLDKHSGYLNKALN